MRVLALGLLALLLCAPAALADDWSLYLNNQKFEAIKSGNADTMLVDAQVFAHAAGVSMDKNEAGQWVMNGKVVTDASSNGGVDYLPLKTAVEDAGLVMEVHPDLQMIDLRQKAVVRSKEEIEKEMLRAYQVTTYAQMNYLYSLVRDALDNRLNLKIDHTVDTHWVTLVEMRSMTGKDGYGYSSARVRGTELRSLDLWVPFGLSPSTTLHAMAHELGHCWQYDHGIFQADPLKMEGFAEWVAAKVLENLTLPGELQSMKANTYSQYRNGLLYYQTLERTRGRQAVLDDMLGAAHK